MHTASELTFRVLPVGEWLRLKEFGPFKEAGGVLPDYTSSIVVVLEDESGELAGCWMVRNMALLEGLYLKESWRHSPMAAKKLLLGMVDVLEVNKVGQAITLIQSLGIERLARTAGFQPLEGKVFLLDRKGE